MEYVVVIILVSLSILFICRHFHKIANGESSCDCCDCKSPCHEADKSCNEQEKDKQSGSHME